MNRRCTAPITVCFCHSSPPRRALAFAISACPATEILASFLPIVLDWLGGLALQLLALPLPPVLAVQKSCPVFPSRWSRSVFFWRAIPPCGKCGSSPAVLRFLTPPKCL